MNHPKWLTDTLVAFNRQTTCLNEWELIDIAVDLHRQPDLPKHLDVLFASLQEGFGPDVVVAGNFLALGYSAGKYQVFSRFVELGVEALALRELAEDEDEEAAVLAFTEVQARVAEAAGRTGGRPLVMQAPYFIRLIDLPTTDTDFPLSEFKVLFDKGEVLYTAPQFVQTPEDVRKWLSRHPAHRYAQRFIFTLGLIVRNGIEDSLKTNSVHESLGHLFGAFLTWAGLGVADSTRYAMAAVATRLAHFSHEFLKPFAEVRRSLDNCRDQVPRELRLALDKLLNQATLPELGAFISTQTTGQGPFDNGSPYGFRERLGIALSRSTTDLPAQTPLADGEYLLNVKLDGQDGSIRLSVHELPAPSVRITFDPSYLDRLVRNLVRNAVQHSRQSPVLLNWTFALDDRYQFVHMHVTHIDARVPGNIRRKLFRMPVQTSSTGLGLWTIGMAFESEHLPAPKVEQIGNDLRFSFCFPTVTK